MRMACRRRSSAVFSGDRRSPELSAFGRSSELTKSSDVRKLDSSSERGFPCRNGKPGKTPARAVVRACVMGNCLEHPPIKSSKAPARTALGRGRAEWNGAHRRLDSIGVVVLRNRQISPVAVDAADPNGSITFYNDAAAFPWGRRPPDRMDNLQKAHALADDKGEKRFDV